MTQGWLDKATAKRTERMTLTPAARQGARIGERVRAQEQLATLKSRATAKMYPRAK